MANTILFLALLGTFLTSCEKKKEAAPPEPPSVTVMVVAKSSEPVVTELPGRLEAYRQAEVRARAAGIVTKRLYQEGQIVKEGTPLFKIDPAPLKAAYDITEGQVASAKAAHIVAKDKLGRYSDLKDEKAVSELEYASAVAEEAQAKAALLSAEAGRKNANLNLQYANVTSPIAGRARRAMVTEGALVGLDSPTPLTIVEQTDPIYVNFAQPASEVIALRKASKKGDLQNIPEDAVKVQIIMADGNPYPQAGKLLFSDLSVDPKTDTVSMRALFPNKDGELLSGAFVNVKLVRAVNNDAVLIPRDALVRGPEAATVMVVNAEQKVQAVVVKATELRGTHWVVTEGLNGGEKVILSNPGMLQPGMVVKPMDKAATEPAKTEAPAAKKEG
ncbi:MAG: MexX/AxyX family multidrug efflux RND transporter periplasmic adaptor subunit [Proteobacteria bacterium]|nr:MAG: MexX/AxyX family multidrug efflux RND transporter periplasmic adaptor subunit [Pseudomonadota bacterium]